MWMPWSVLAEEAPIHQEIPRIAVRCLNELDYKKSIKGVVDFLFGMTGRIFCFNEPY